MSSASVQSSLNFCSVFLVSLWGLGMAEWVDSFAAIQRTFGVQYSVVLHLVVFLWCSVVFFKLYAWTLRRLSSRLSGGSWQLIS